MIKSETNINVLSRIEEVFMMIDDIFSNPETVALEASGLTGIVIVEFTANGRAERLMFSPATDDD